MEQELLKLLKDKLSITIESIDVYNGCSGDREGNMYHKEFQVSIYFGDELITKSLSI